MYVVIVVALLDIINLQVVKSANLSLVIAGALISVVIWVAVGTFIVYYAQNRMKHWYKFETSAHNFEEFNDLVKKYDDIYKKWSDPDAKVRQNQVTRLKRRRENLEY
jgi:hypothetical protein